MDGAAGMAEAGVLLTSRSGGCGCKAVAGLASVDEALAIVDATARPVEGVETLPLGSACGRVLAVPVHAAADAPRFDASAMDGYALSLASLVGAEPWSLPVSARLAAGTRLERLVTGTAARIFTGAPIPEGADTVVMQEDVLRDSDTIILNARPRAGENIRPRGQDMTKGCETLPAGRCLDPRDIALAAASGAGTLVVYRRLRVRLFSTGAELAEPGAPLASGAIWDVNRAMLAAQIAEPSVDLADGGCLPDASAAVAAALIEAALAADLVVTSGGASVGEEDHLADAIVRAGGKILLRKVAMKPGKPLTLARLGQTLVLALPGNPVAAFVGWHVFGRRLVLGLQGAEHHPCRMFARLAKGVTRRPGRCEFRPARIAGTGPDGLPLLILAPAEFSARVAELARADGLALIPAETDRLAPGDMVQFEPLAAIGSLLK